MSEPVAGFDLDAGDRKKAQKHGVTLEEIETALRGPKEQRFIRPISARFMHAKEIIHYEAQSQDPRQAAASAKD